MNAKEGGGRALFHHHGRRRQGSKIAGEGGRHGLARKQGVKPGKGHLLHFVQKNTDRHSARILEGIVEKDGRR